MIRVLVDGRCVHGALHGIARYTLALVEQLGVVDPELRLAVICHPDSAHRFAALGVTVVKHRCPFVDPRAPLVLGRLARSLQPDVFFCPSFMVPVGSSAPLVLTLHDATHLLFPQHYSSLVGLFYRLVTLPIARRAPHVITVSHFSALSLRETAQIENIEAIHNGVDLHTFTAEGPGDPRLPARCVLYAGGFKPHKRVGLLLAAVAPLNDTHLAITGNIPREIETQAHRLGLGPRLLRLGVLDDGELAAAYRAATVFAYPSAHEGFGLPPLEAMACGTPVLVANSSSLPEVVGDAGKMFNGQVTDLRQALVELLDDDNTRMRLRQRGLQRVAQFTWEATARRVAAVLRSAALGSLP